MWRLTLAQMRRSIGKLAAVGIAIALGTAFIAATFLATSTIEATALQAAKAGVGDPDLIIRSDSYDLTDSDLAEIEAFDGVATTQAIDMLFREVTTVNGSEYLGLSSPAADPRLSQVTLLEGAFPSTDGQIALPAGTANRLEVEIGDGLEVVNQVWTEDSDTPTETRYDATVVGITADGSGLGFGMPLGLISSADRSAWHAEDGGTGWGTVSVALDDTSALSAVRAWLESNSKLDRVLTGDEYAREVAASFTGGVSAFGGVILGFAAIAMAVAGIVIANTFTVLVAQRTRTLALLRCVGATKKQIRSSVRQEALLLGVGASVIGILAGIGLGQLVLSVLGGANEGVPLPAVVPVTLWTILVPLVVGVGVTVISAGGAARAATRVAPLAAMRPASQSSDDGVSVDGKRRFNPRAVFGWILVALGSLAMVGAIVWSLSIGAENFMLTLAIGVLGGLVSMVGVVMAAITIVPALTRLLGRLAARFGGAPSRLAATNAVRNPARTTSTATALLVGVALVTMMATGASTASSQLDGMLKDQFAVDVAVTSGSGALSPATIEAVKEVDGVTGSTLMDAAYTEVTTAAGTTGASILRVEDTAGLLNVVRSAPDSWASRTGYADGYILSEDGSLQVGDGTAMPGVLLNGIPDYTVLLTADAFDEAGLEVETQTLWLSIAEDADPRAVISNITDAVSSTSGSTDSPTPGVSGGAVERAGYSQIIDTMLIVVIGLLGVAVVIALLGVANTLSLSVVERRQENALLRALGLTKRQLRSSLAVEGVLLALVGAIVGIVLGMAYGWIGSQLMLGPISGMVGGGAIALTVPWLAIGLVTLVAVVAGVLASVLPARGAVKVAPVAALAA